MARLKKPRRKVRPPKLCTADIFIYGALLVLFIILFFMPYLLVIILQNKLFLASGEVLAYEKSPWLLLGFLPGLVMLAPGIWLDIRWIERKPFVGPRLSQEGPLVKKAPRQGKKPHERRAAVFAAVVMGIWALLCIPAVGAIFARTEVTATEVRVYTLFGIETRTTPLSEVIAIETRISTSKSGSWYASYKVTMKDGEPYSFSAHPLTLVELDSSVPPCPRTVKGLRYFDSLCREYHLNGEEAARVRMLFRS